MADDPYAELERAIVRARMGAGSGPVQEIIDQLRDRDSRREAAALRLRDAVDALERALDQTESQP